MATWMTSYAASKCVVLLRVQRYAAFCLFSSLLLDPCLYAQAHEPVHGTVQGHTYSDSRFGLSYEYPDTLETMSSLPNGMPVGTGEKQGVSEFLFSAMEKPNGIVRKGVFIVTDPKGTFGANDVPQYLRQLLVLSLGAKEPIEISPIVIRGQSFFRASVGGEAQVHFYGAQLSTLCGDHFLDFVFSGPSPEKVEELVRSLDRLRLNCPASKP